jgi:hypothetical protein
MSRTEFLTHWTGKDIETNVARLDSASRRAYLERLKTTLRDGLWMMKPGELLVSTYGGLPATIELKPNMTCFTELRLSDARPHFARYGLLGFVVRRVFVLERGGGPVLYTRQHDDEMLVKCAARVLEWSATNAKAVEDVDDIRRAMMLICAYMKPMSTPNSDDFAFLDEHEWRIVQSGPQIDAGRIVRTGLDRPFYRIPLGMTDLKMMIVPDEEVRRAALLDPELRARSGTTSVPILTVEEIEYL